MRFLFVIQADLALQSFSEGVTDHQQRGLREGLWLGQLPEGTAGLREVGRVVKCHRIPISSSQDTANSGYLIISIREDIAGDSTIRGEIAGDSGDSKGGI